jgi:hypothetical protein
MSSEKRHVHTAADEIPRELTQVILAGNCVAFVGAGFSAQVVPTWKDLLLRIAAKCGAEEKARIRPLLESETPRDIDFVAAAEMLRDALGTEQVVQELRSRVGQAAARRPHETATRVAARDTVSSDSDDELRWSAAGTIARRGGVRLGASTP